MLALAVALPAAVVALPAAVALPVVVALPAKVLPAVGTLEVGNGPVYVPVIVEVGKSLQSYVFNPVAWTRGS